MRSVESATAARPTERVHFEGLTAAKTATSPDQPFTVILSRSGACYGVPARRSILEVLEAHGAGVPYSCREGLCGTCLTTVPAGEIDHRDHVLTPGQNITCRDIMLCVSRARGAVLDLDL